MPEMQGRRVDHWFTGTREPGDYGFVDVAARDETGVAKRELWIIDPFGHVGRIVTHTITEEPDGTVTVQPSIAPGPGDPPGSFHGWLTKGVWTW